MEVLKLSYDELDDKEQSMFLDIACFFIENKNDAEKMLGDSGITSLNVLIDLFLLSLIYEICIDMHDLIRKMGQQIVCQQSKEFGKRSHLWCPEDVYHILKNNTGTDVVECISLDMSEIKEVHLSAAALAKMPNLRLLKFYQSRLLDNHFSSKVHIPDVLERVSDRLQLFHWDGYPCKFLPLDFSLENLVELNMRGSHLEHLWDGIQELPSLRTIVLSYSKHLTEIPDLCRAPNLQHVFLSDCEKIKKCPVVTSENMVQLDLCKTAIEEVPSSIGSLAKLKSLGLSDCELLKELPSSISNLQSLFQLKFSGCLRLEKFPDITEPMENLKRLRIERTAIKELPSSIQNLVGLVHLILLNCDDLEFIPRSICNLNSLKVFCISDCPKIVKLPSISCGLCSLESLSVNDCINLSEIPDDIGCLSSLRKLSLCGSNIESIPASIKLATNLRRLYLSYSKRLQSLPILPPSLIHLDAIDCPLLYGNIMAKAELAIRYCLDERRSFEGIFPGSEVPKWFPYQSMGPSLTIKWIRPNWGTAEFCGFVVCIVFSVEDEIPPWEDLCQYEIKIGDHPVELLYYNYYNYYHNYCQRYYSRRFKKDHTIVSYYPNQNLEFDYSLPRGGSDDYHDVTFTILSGKDTFKVKKFGIYLTFSPDPHKEDDKHIVQEDDEDKDPNACSVM
ncbi:putative disease resistance protein (TIR-NBS-LRR class) [Quillaja saponaria]|uniref:Disease resistance protein (TIR-NBS-LRR class) n=1 Tax=Quillaja saponaria TaxID=32244 RepID=A0AAD7PPC3_QUISA|nr:putative disease resistance protein (TIR-NBS-LRR class) [Quillaja saponaria]